MTQPKLLVFASGTETSGGSGFENLVHASRSGILNAKIVGVVSNHAGGGVRRRADKLGIPFNFFPKPWTWAHYQEIVKAFHGEYVALSGWVKLVTGLDPRKTINIHPAPLPDYGGVGMYGRAVHQAVLEAYHQKKITTSAVNMHFVTEEYDKGPLFFRYPIPILENDSAETLQTRVSAIEHYWQPLVTNLVIMGKIFWDGVEKTSLRVPEDYHFC